MPASNARKGSVRFSRSEKFEKSKNYGARRKFCGGRVFFVFYIAFAPRNQRFREETENIAIGEDMFFEG